MLIGGILPSDLSGGSVLPGLGPEWPAITGVTLATPASSGPETPPVSSRRSRDSSSEALGAVSGDASTPLSRTPGTLRVGVIFRGGSSSSGSRESPELRGATGGVSAARGRTVWTETWEPLREAVRRTRSAAATLVAWDGVGDGPARPPSFEREPERWDLRVRERDGRDRRLGELDEEGDLRGRRARTFRLGRSGEEEEPDDSDEGVGRRLRDFAFALAGVATALACSASRSLSRAASSVSVAVRAPTLASKPATRSSRTSGGPSTATPVPGVGVCRETGA